MRRQRFWWTYLVLAFVITVYGGFSLIYNASHNKAMSPLGLTFFIIGVMMFILFGFLYIATIIQMRKKKKEEDQIIDTTIEEVEEPEVKEEPQEEVKVEKEEPTPEVKKDYRDEVVYERVSRPSRRSFDGDSGYVRKVGYGPVLRINEAEILDMRTNTYYRIEGNMVNMAGSGPAYEISGNRIRAAFGGYLYEISGSNVNKTFGGYYASLSGGYLQTHDLSEKYEVPSMMNMAQKLAVVAILFGTY